jgi:hypothetical protein
VQEISCDSSFDPLYGETIASGAYSHRFPKVWEVSSGIITMITLWASAAVAGLMGLYLVRDAFEDEVNLPKGRYETPLILFDRSFMPDGQIFYPVPSGQKRPGSRSITEAPSNSR